MMTPSNDRLNPIECVIAQNNHAVSLLASPEGYNDAISHLKAAVSSMKSLAAGIAPPSESKRSLPEPSAWIPGINDCMKDSMCECLPPSSIHNDGSYHDDDDDDETPYIYRKAIEIPMELGRIGHGTDTSLQNSMISCMLIFNLALAHHLSAVETTVEDVAVALWRALKLYELAFQLHRGGAWLHRESDDIHFVLAVTNNFGLIRRQLGEEAEATKCFQTVLSILMVLADQQGASARCLNGFFRNVHYLVSKLDAAPAA